MSGGSAERWHLCFYLNHKAAFSQQYGSPGKGYSGQGRDESEVPRGSWGWPASLFKTDELRPINMSVPCLVS